VVGFPKVNIATPDIFARIYAAHGHRCPMSTLGGRLGMAVKQALGAFPDEQLRALYRSRTCALDGIALVLGCSEENGLLRVQSDGRHRLEAALPGRRIAAELTPFALQLAGTYRQLANRLEAGWEELAAAEQDRRTRELDAALDALLPQLWTAGESDLITLTEEAVA